MRIRLLFTTHFFRFKAKSALFSASHGLDGFGAGPDDHSEGATFVAEGVAHMAGEIFVAVKPVETGHVAISIRDQGQGIPENKLEAVFTRFYSERPSNEVFGEHSGLGLSIARQIAEAHGGTLTAKNSNKGGACFTLTLPLV